MKRDHAAEPALAAAERPETQRNPDQACFWSEKWQRMEQEVEAEILAGQIVTFDDADSFLTDLDKTVGDANIPARGNAS